MSSEIQKLKKKRWAYRNLIAELGLAPPPADRTAADWKPQAVAEKSIETLKALGDSAGVEDKTNWIISPAVIEIFFPSRSFE